MSTLVRFGRRAIPAAALVTLVILAVACGGDDDDGSSSAATSSATTGTGASSEAEFDDYIGLTVADATAKAEADDRPSRVIEEDGEKFPVTMDFIPERLNFVVVDGEVTAVTTG